VTALVLRPDSQVEVHHAPDGRSTLIEPVRKSTKKPASVLFDRAMHHGADFPVEAMDAALVMAQQAQFEVSPDAS